MRDDQSICISSPLTTDSIYALQIVSDSFPRNRTLWKSISQRCMEPETTS